jgi:hypothetical protein
MSIPTAILDPTETFVANNRTSRIDVKRPLRTAWAVVAIDESGHHASVRRSPLSANASVQLDPIRMPAPSTSAPPIITFPAAESGGTSM